MKAFVTVTVAVLVVIGIGVGLAGPLPSAPGAGGSSSNAAFTYKVAGDKIAFDAKARAFKVRLDVHNTGVGPGTPWCEATLLGPGQTSPTSAQRLAVEKGPVFEAGGKGVVTVAIAAATMAFTPTNALARCAATQQGLVSKPYVTAAVSAKGFAGSMSSWLSSFGQTEIAELTSAGAKALATARLRTSLALVVTYSLEVVSWAKVGLRGTQPPIPEYRLAWTDALRALKNGAGSWANLASHDTAKAGKALRAAETHLIGKISGDLTAFGAAVTVLQREG